jgi:hypothetical protein
MTFSHLARSFLKLDEMVWTLELLKADTLQVLLSVIY